MGIVSPDSPATDLRAVKEFWQRLRELGWVEGENLMIERRWVEGRTDRLPGIMKDLVERGVDVIAAGGTPAVVAAARATRTVPVVSLAMVDPVGNGVAASLARPGGNVTGLSLQYEEGLPGKLLGLLQETMPNLSAVAVISNPASPMSGLWEKQLSATAPALGVKILFLHVTKREDLAGAMKQARRHARAIMVVPDPMTTNHRREVVNLAAKQRLPGMYSMRDFVDDGGLISYGIDMNRILRRGAEYVDKILKGAKPADLPIEQPTKFELVVNLKTAKALGITIPQSILQQADEVIR
ncbi:MAG: ABC transporter substrate-binding protein [Betaproteobacteria bacterium]